MTSIKTSRIYDEIISCQKGDFKVILILLDKSYVGSPVLLNLSNQQINDEMLAKASHFIALPQHVQ